MGLYRIEWKSSAAKELRKLPKNFVIRILNTVEQLSANPFPIGVKKLVGTKDMYRIRIGDYRVVYSIVKSALVIEIIRIGHRKDVYKET